MVFADYAPLDHILPRYLSTALLRRLNRKNIKTVGHSSLRWVGLAHRPDLFSSLPRPRPELEDLSGAAAGAAAAGAGHADHAFDAEGLTPGHSGPVALPPPPPLSNLGQDINLSGAVEETAAVDGNLALEDRKKQRRQLQVMTAHSFDHLDTATHSTDRVVLAGVVGVIVIPNN